MSKWIDADAVESTLQEMEMITAMSHIEFGEEDDDIGEISMPMFTVRNIMKTAPSIDLVRCGECAYKGEINCPMYYRDRELKPTDFCSYGERSE